MKREKKDKCDALEVTCTFVLTRKVLVWTLLLLDSVLIATIYLPLPRRIPYVDYKP
jgi:hypothetical protein